MTPAAAPYAQTPPPDERAHSIDALLDSTMYPALGGITIWRGSQLGGRHTRVVTCGDAALSAELPGGGWPQGALTDLLVQQPGCGEIRLLRPALAALANRPLMFLQPPHRVQPAALAWWGLPALNISVLRAAKTADALWAAEQVLRAGTCAVLIFWQSHVRPESLRGLHLEVASFVRTGSASF
jgi:protein ImuA